MHKPAIDRELCGPGRNLAGLYMPPERHGARGQGLNTWERRDLGRRDRSIAMQVGAKARGSPPQRLFSAITTAHFALNTQQTLPRAPLSSTKFATGGASSRSAWTALPALPLTS